MTFIFVLKALLFFIGSYLAIETLRYFKNRSVRFTFEVENYFQENLPSHISELSLIFHHAKFDLFLVGGCIRDAFLKKIPKDYDLCTNALPEQVIKVLTQNGYQCKLQGEHFGVVVVSSIIKITK
jgi:hypothetical protein